VSENIGSKSVHKSLGFVETGEVSGDENEYELVAKLDI
jgi:hypothetical protein